MSVSPSTLTKKPQKSLQPLVPLSASDPSFRPLLPPKSIKHSSSSALINEAQWGMDVVLNYLTKCKNFRIGQPLRIITKSSYYKRNSTPRVYTGTIYRKEEKKHKAILFEILNGLSPQYLRNIFTNRATPYTLKR